MSKINIILSLFCGCIILITTTLTYHYHNQLSTIKEQCYKYLETSIYTFNTKKDTKPDYVFKNHQSRSELYRERITIFKQLGYEFDQEEDSILFFAKDEEWEYRTFINSDTIINRKVKKKEKVSTQQLLLQTILMDTGSLDVDFIVKIYTEYLNENNISLNYPIYLSIKSNIHDNVHYKNFNSEDEIVYNYITPVIYTGRLDEVEYRAYLNISFASVYDTIPKHYVRPLYITLLILLLALLYYYFKDRNNKKEIEIINLGDNRYHLGHVTFDFNKKELHYEGTTEMRSRSADLLLLFLQDKDFQLNRDFLVTYFGSDTNMSTAVNLLRKNLKRSSCRYTLNSYRQLGVYKLEIPPRKSNRSYLGSPKKWWKKLKRIVGNFELE